MLYEVITLTDHNSALNVPAFFAACRERGIAPLAGIEAQTSEECHALCLFSDAETALALGEELYDLMPPVMNIPEKTGDQVYVDENDDILVTNPILNYHLAGLHGFNTQLGD